MTFAAAPEYQVFPTRERPLKPYEAAVRGRGDDARVRARRSRPTSPSRTSSRAAPALAAELEGVPRGDARPARLPGPRRPGSRRSRSARGCRARGSGARCGRRPTGWWRSGSSRGACEYNDCRARLGLAPLPYVHTGLSRSLTMVGTLPQLEYPRAWPSWMRVVGPLLWEPGGPLVVAGGRATGRSCWSPPRPRRTPRTRCCEPCLDGLADEPVRVIAISAERVAAPAQRRARAVDVLRARRCRAATS